ncbi:MAG: ATP-grasp domain-containing protein [Chloroflexota bacterium]|nr:ATP-grasp domain-containing protein [Chloroflexota bacterium]
MIIIEYEAKARLRAHGLSIPSGQIADTPDQAREAAAKIDGAVVVKAQVPTGGRMKAGLIRFAATPDDAEREARSLFSMSARGFPVERLLIEQRLNIVREVFIGAAYDAAARTAILLASAGGGIDVETAGNMIRIPFSASGVSDYNGRDTAAALGVTGKSFLELSRIAKSIAQTFIDSDALLLECNPIILDDAGRWWIADVHLEIDDDALFRQTSVIEQCSYSQRTTLQRTAFEQRAIEIDQADHRGVAGRLIPFDGDIGVLIGGGGASLTTMDALLDAGLQPANYCEIGGNPSVWKVKELTKLILSQPQVTRLIVVMNVVSNTRVDLIARGVIKGILELGRDPADLIAAFRVPGSWEDEGAKLLDHYGVRHFGRETTIEEVIEHIR